MKNEEKLINFMKFCKKMVDTWNKGGSTCDISIGQSIINFSRCYDTFRILLRLNFIKNKGEKNIQTIKTKFLTLQAVIYKISLRFHCKFYHNIDNYSFKCIKIQFFFSLSFNFRGKVPSSSAVYFNSRSPKRRSKNRND